MQFLFLCELDHPGPNLYKRLIIRRKHYLSAPWMSRLMSLGEIKIFLTQMKSILFGNPGVYMTKQRCEEFFDNDNNFDLGEIDIEGMLVWIAEKMGIPYAPVAHA